MPRRRTVTAIEAEFYKHPESESLLGADVGTQAQFRKEKPRRSTSTIPRSHRNYRAYGQHEELVCNGLQ
jgi:hypothetical protein